MSPISLSYVKKLFHLLTIVAAFFAAYPATGFPPRVAIYITLVSGLVSGLLHVLTTLFPQIAADETKQ